MSFFIFKMDFEKIALCVFLIILCAQDCVCLRNVSLESPRYVQKGESAVLICHYDLQGATLYSVKWYRGQREFYRYCPSESPATKIFPFPGINVDLSQSNESQVVLHDVGFNLSGNLSCEVTAEAPPVFLNSVVSTHMAVHQIPDRGPVVHTNQQHYKTGDVLSANCTSPPSRPPATLSFLLNNNPVGTPETRVHPSDDQLQWSSLSLNLMLLPSHFVNGHLVLKCTAVIASIYRDTAEVQLTSRGKEPVPERVTSPSKASTSGRFALPAVILHLGLIIRAAR
ncbi:uncharacterized protein LOC142318314 [Lycorma delicatula]|uniref:uncharacterized protein LOC142318314 n=1 Tax=Lycorma delicatula TaxID=130591 RepID=UPI003F514008